MGNVVGIDCCRGTQQFIQTDMFIPQFGQDNLQANLEHIDKLIVRSHSAQSITRQWESKLKQSKKMYKDPLVKTQPILLESKHKAISIECTYLRPYSLLPAQTQTTTTKYQIFQIQPAGPSSIVIRDQALQYFGVFLCFISENPRLLKQMILTQANSFGLHVVAMHNKGRLRELFIDDYLLCHQQQPKFTQPIHNHYFWPCLLEKAWFKFISKTQAIDKLTPLLPYQAFLAHPVAQYMVNSANKQLINTVIANCAGNRPGRGCIVTTHKSPQHKIGLSGQQFYYLLFTFSYNTQIYYYLRNPCGVFQFRGSNAIPSKQILSSVMSRTDEKEIPAGNFILEQQQFFQQIELLIVLHYQQTSSMVSAQQIEMQTNYQFFIQISVKKEALLSLQLVQQTAQLPLTYQVFRMENSSLISGDSNQQGCFGFKHTNLLQDVYRKLEPGKYLIRLKNKPQNDPKNQSQVGFFRPQAVAEAGLRSKLVVTAPFQVTFDFLRIQYFGQRFYQFLLDQGRRNMGTTRQSRRLGQADYQHVSFWLGDLILIYIKNTNANRKEVRVEVRFPQTVNLECLSHKIGKDFFSLPAFDNDTIIVFQKMNLTAATSLGSYFVESF